MGEQLVLFGLHEAAQVLVLGAVSGAVRTADAMGDALGEPVPDVIDVADEVVVLATTLLVAVVIPAVIVDEDVHVVGCQLNADLDWFGVQLCGDAIDF
jgi:hypothetical protein